MFLVEFDIQGIRRRYLLSLLFLLLVKVFIICLLLNHLSDSQSRLHISNPPLNFQNDLLKLQIKLYKKSAAQNPIMVPSSFRVESKLNRGWDGWMAPLTPWIWVWASSGSWWWTGKPGVLQSTGSQRVGHDWVTELIQLNHFVV